ncbi:MAG: hypothetical protein KDM91_02285 [Verrucomicrobiae bacterium]|nr:hypothetical protein [Verrucomicrobiae bacterium]
MIRKLFSLIRGESDAPAKQPSKPAEAAPGHGEAPGRKPAGPPKPVSNKPNTAARTPEAMCGIDPKKMTPEEIKNRLAELYRRHNQAAGSLNEELRQEAELMLDAIVACRQKYLDKG